tara:strand:+ start:47064 stop:47249 length:186 start_codon:yes stop_codon:yes gene_type:complete
MSFLGKLTRAAVGVVVSPIDIAKDVVTMGGALTDKDEPYSVTRAKQVANDITSLPDEIDKE